jgi:putative membrane protein
MKRIFSLSSMAVFTVFFLCACDGSSTNVSVNANANRGASNANAGSNTNSNGSTLGNMANSLSNAVSGATTSSPDSFMRDAAQANSAEIELGKLAGTNGQSADVKSFGKMMVDDHGKAGKEAEELAKKKNMTLPTDLGSHQSTVDKLKGLKGADFDKQYVDEMVNGHEKVVSMFEKEAANSSDPDVKAFAAKTLPTIRKHLDRIKEIQAKMNK